MNKPSRDGVWKDPAGVEPPPRSDGTWVRGLVGLMAVNAAGLGWLAARASVPESSRPAMDAIVQLAAGGAVAFAAYYMLTRFAFRTLELVAMVLVLGVGVQATIAALETFAELSFWWDGPVTMRQDFAGVMLACLLTGSLLLIGAAWGLRYCEKLHLEGSGIRVWAMLCGMLLLPAVSCFVGLPFGVLAESFQEQPDELASVLGVVGWFFSVIVCIWNVKFFVASLALQSSIADE